MKSVLLDTSFIMTAVRQKIDFFHELQMQGFSVLIPDKVLRELESLSKKQDARLALVILQKNKFRKVAVNGRTVDSSIVNFARENPLAAIATLDREIKRKVKNPKILIRQKKRLGLA